MSHRVVVSDSSVLIDLERGSLFTPAFALPLEFCVPDLLYQRELPPQGGHRLLELGLRVVELDARGVSRAIFYRRAVPALSLPDAFALALAHCNGATLLTGDARLRQLASDENVICHGLLWLIDLMFDHRTATATDLHDGLLNIRDHPRCRLPKAEVNKRLRTFSRAATMPISPVPPPKEH